MENLYIRNYELVKNGDTLEVLISVHTEKFLSHKTILTINDFEGTWFTCEMVKTRPTLIGHREYIFKLMERDVLNIAEFFSKTDPNLLINHKLDGF